MDNDFRSIEIQQLYKAYNVIDKSNWDIIFATEDINLINLFNSRNKINVDDFIDYIAKCHLSRKSINEDILAFVLKHIKKEDIYDAIQKTDIFKQINKF